MITDIHRHFVPASFFEFVCSRPEFQVVIKCREGDRIDADIRGMHFGLNTTFFDLAKQFEQMDREGVERAVLSLATPFIDYNHDGEFAIETAVRYNDALADAIAIEPKRCRAWARALIACKRLAPRLHRPRNRNYFKAMPLIAPSGRMRLLTRTK